MIDTHAHLYSNAYKNDVEVVLQNAKLAGVAKIFLPAIDSSTHKQMLDLQIMHSNYCYAMLGLHPCSVNAQYKEELDIIKTLLQQNTVYGIGETGLDFYWDKTFVNQQYEALHAQINLALNYQLPLILHTRNATKETIAVVTEYKGKGLTGIFHCFGGTAEEALQIIETNFFLGIGGVVTYKNAGLAEVLKDIPLSAMVLETDAPYLSPVPYRGKRNESAYISHVAEKLALVKNTTLEEIITVTAANALSVFKL